MDRKFVISAPCYALLGMVLGIHMAASRITASSVTHAHIMLVRFVVSFIYALCHRLWLDNPSGRLVSVQFYLHQLGALVMSAGLYLLYGGCCHRSGSTHSSPPPPRCADRHGDQCWPR